MEQHEAQIPIYTRDDAMEILRQAHEELEFECSPTADALGGLIFQLACEWDVELKPRP